VVQNIHKIKCYFLRFKIKVTFGENFPKLHQTNWNVARNNVNVVVDELRSQITIYTCLTTGIWIQRRGRTSMRFGAIRQKWRASTQMVPKCFYFIMTPVLTRKRLVRAIQHT
jgi:hypothetical protein